MLTLLRDTRTNIKSKEGEKQQERARNLSSKSFFTCQVGMSKGDSNLNFLKTQTCVLKVNICCDGCKIKVKKLLQKIDGVYTINIDSEKGKVTVSGSASPAALIKKLRKAGKHAELLGPRSGNSNSFHEQLQKLHLQQKGNGNPTKTGAGGGGGGKEQKGQQLLQQMKDPKFPPQKDQKNAKFSFPSEEEDGSDFDDDDDEDMYDSEDGDDDLDGFEGDHKDGKKKPMKESGGGGKKESHSHGGGFGGKDGKNGGDKNKKGAGPNGNGKDSNNGGKTKKGGGVAGGANFNPKTTMGGGQGIQGMSTGTMGAPVGRPMNLAAGGVPPGYYQGGMAAAQQQQQQYMAAMQQRMMMNGPMHYGQQPTMGYSQPMGQMPPPPPAYGEPAYAHYFSDENPNSCSVM